MIPDKGEEQDAERAGGRWDWVQTRRRGGNKRKGPENPMDNGRRQTVGMPDETGIEMLDDKDCYSNREKILKELYQNNFFKKY